MVRRLAPVRMPDGSDEALKECPFVVGHQIACQGHLPRRDDLESQPDAQGNPFCQHNLEHGGIGLTATKAFKRDFVHWAVEHFQWPGKTAEEMFRYNKVLNEADFPPLELLLFMLIRLRLGRHYKGTFRATNDGRMYAGQPGALFDKLVPFFLLAMDHASYSRTGEEAPGNWDTSLNVMNVEIEN